MQKKGVAEDMLFWIALGTITLIILFIVIYAFSGGANDVVNTLPF